MHKIFSRDFYRIPPRAITLYISIAVRPNLQAARGTCFTKNFLYVNELFLSRLLELGGEVIVYLIIIIII